MQIKNRRGIVLGIAMGIAASMPTHAESGSRTAAISGSISSTVVLPAVHRLVLRGVITDRVLHRNWAVFDDRDHPARPPQMVELATSTSSEEMKSLQPTRPVKTAAASAPAGLPGFRQQAVSRPIVVPLVLSHLGISPAVRNVAQPGTSSPLLIRAGDRVHLWSVTANVCLEIEAVALDYGHAGQVIHLRRLGRAANQGILLTGIVNGDGSAELLP